MPPALDLNEECMRSSIKEYLLPYNDVEIQRLQEQQKSMSMMFDGRIVVAPVDIKDNSGVLDVAAGSGAWALDFAERYPNANTTKITCLDIDAQMFPKHYPNNMTFEVGSALALPGEWTNKFTLVHQRLLAAGIKYEDWERNIGEIYRVTAPGGWAQLCEWNNRTYDRAAAGILFKAGRAETTAMDLMMRLGAATGHDFYTARRIPALMAAAGFVDVQVESRAIPLGAWNGDLSDRFAKNLATVFRGMKEAILSQGGLGIVQTGEAYDHLIDEVEHEWASGPGGYESYIQALTEIYEGRVLIAPIELNSGCEILDVATGSGVWALDFAERHPNAADTSITCINIGAQMFPHIHPPNVTFKVASALSMPPEWTNKFTLVHQRLILTGIKRDEWEQDVKEIYRVTAPSGWAQICEYNSGYRVPGITPGSATLRSEELYTRLGEQTGIDFFCARRIPGLMKAAGFVGVDVERRIVPLGGGTGQGISKRVAETMIATFRGFKAVVLKYGGLGVVESGEQYDEQVDAIEREWAAGPGAHVVWDVFVGRKGDAQ